MVTHSDILTYTAPDSQGVKVGSGRRPAVGGTALRAWTGVGGCLDSIPRPCILPLSPPFVVGGCKYLPLRDPTTSYEQDTGRSIQNSKF